MGYRTNASNKIANSSRSRPNGSSHIGIVVDVILNEEHPRLEKTDNSDRFTSGVDTTRVGNCVIRPVTDQVSNEAELLDYSPLDVLNLDVPIIGETVELVKIGNALYYRRITKGNLNTGNAKLNFNKHIFELTEPQSNTASSYSKTSQTQIPNTSNHSTRDTSYGVNFKPTQINKLKLNDGDKVMQSRFGQSIRFSAYNNPNGTFAPTIIIRNRQNQVSLDNLKPGDLVDEDINRDGSIIVLSSKEYPMQFQPGTVDDGGSSNFESLPDSFTDYPNSFDDTDTTLISSDRIILSSKSAEMIFYSKGNYGFISDGKFSIDNGNDGALLNFNGDVILNTNDSDTYILGGKGSVYLNTESDKEPLVRGNALVDVLDEILNAIIDQTFLTPSGPSAVGPVNLSVFKKIQEKLDSIKSTLNFTE